MKTTGTVTKKLALGRGSRGKKVAAEPAPTTSRVPRITKLMALAIKFDQMIRDGVVKDQAELARLGFVTRARVTQIMNLLNLAAPIQERLLTLPNAAAGRDSVTEREVRPIVEINCWKAQQDKWRARSIFVICDSRAMVPIRDSTKAWDVDSNSSGCRLHTLEDCSL